MYRKSYCTTSGVGVGGGKMLKFYVKDFYGMARQAILYADRSCFPKDFNINIIRMSTGRQF